MHHGLGMVTEAERWADGPEMAGQAGFALLADSDMTMSLSVSSYETANDFSPKRFLP
jgi:hypothetical protein